MRRAHLAAAVAAALVTLAAPQPATAVYRPQLALTFDTYKPAAAPAVTAVLRQASGEDSTRAIAVRFPPGFTLNPELAVRACPAPEVAAGTCPEHSRIGSANAQTMFGPAEGHIHLTEDFRLLIEMRGLAGLVEVRLLGAIRALDDGTAELTFDGLPPVPMTETRIALGGGARAIFINPRRCGRYEPGARFTSHVGDQVAVTIPIDITGCAAAPRLASVRLSSARIRAGRPVVLSWRLDRAVSRAHVTLFRAAGATWRELGTVSRPGAAGDNALRIGRRFAGHTLRAGTYRFVLRAHAQDGAVSRARTARLVVLA